MAAMRQINGIARKAATALFCLGMAAFTCILSSAAGGDGFAWNEGQPPRPIALHSEILGNALQINVKNVGSAPLTLRKITPESINYEVWSMLRLASGQIQLNTVKTLPAQVHSGDDSEELRASLGAIIRGKCAVTLQPGEEITSLIDMDQLVAPYQPLLKSNAETKLIVAVSLPQLIVGLSEPEKNTPEPAIELSRIKFYLGKYLLSGDQWRDTASRREIIPTQPLTQSAREAFD